MQKIKPYLLMTAIILVFASARSCPAQGLQVTYGAQGVQTLAYQGVTLENLSQNGADAFHIWHMKMTDLSGNPATCGQCGWGEVNNGKSWNPTTQTWTYTFSWGSISVQFQQSGNTLNMVVTTTNLANSGYIFDGATIYPFVLNFPQLPAGFVNAAYAQLAYQTIGPGVTAADYGAGEVVAVDPDSSKPLYSGYMPTGNGFSFTPIMSGTTPDGLATFLPHNDRPVLPGQTDYYTVSLRFAPSGTATGTLAADAYQDWAQAWPSQLSWTDRRAIGTVYLASSPSGNANQPGGYPNNPRRYFNDSNPNDFDVTTTAGLARFQSKVLAQAAGNVTNAQQMNAQGLVTWDLEGEQYPQATSYVCSPDQIATVAPEMESVITDPSSPYVGMKLDDAYFKIMTNAGLRVGVCLRPQQFAINPDGTAQQTFLPDSAIPALLIAKAQYAHDRWGTTLFYVDSTVESDGAVLDASIFQQLAQALPDSLFMPEESTPKYYAYTAPFLSFIFHGTTGTDPTVYNYYPKAFSAILVNDVAAATLAASQAALTTSVMDGDLLMGHADYWDANNPTIVKIYQNAAAQAPAPAPTPTPPLNLVPQGPTSSTPTTTPVSIVSPSSGATLSGAVIVVAQINVAIGSGGSYLKVDGAEIGTNKVAAAPFDYPLDTTKLTKGQHTLQIWVQPKTGSAVLSAPVIVTVDNTPSKPAPPPPPKPTPISTTPPNPTPTSEVAIESPTRDAIVCDTIAVKADVDINLGAAGSYLMVDGIEIGTDHVTQKPFKYTLDTKTLSNGTHTLQIWAHTTGTAVDYSATVPVIIANKVKDPPTPKPDPKITLTYPVTGQGIWGVVPVTATITGPLRSEETHLLVDGETFEGSSIDDRPYIYLLNTGKLTPGRHKLQVWVRDASNQTLLSNPVTVTVTAPKLPAAGE